MKIKETSFSRIGMREWIFNILQTWLYKQKALIKNKLCALALLGVGALSVLIDEDATALIFLLLFAIPLLLARENCIS